MHTVRVEVRAKVRVEVRAHEQRCECTRMESSGCEWQNPKQFLGDESSSFKLSSGHERTKTMFFKENMVFGVRLAYITVLLYE